MKSRYISQQLRHDADSINGRIIVLTGARQTGKTTLVRTYLPDYQYISIEDPVATDALVRLTAAQWMDL